MILGGLKIATDPTLPKEWFRAWSRRLTSPAIHFGEHAVSDLLSWQEHQIPADAFALDVSEEDLGVLMQHFIPDCEEPAAAEAAA